MGLLTQAKDRAFSTKQTISQTVPVGQAGTAQSTDTSYERFAREGYTQNELVFACIEELATSAAEPRFIGRRRTPGGMEQVEDHELLDLLNNPNPFMSRFDMVATMIMHRKIAGNAYIHKERAASGRPVELWILRPDRVQVVPSATEFVAGYKYTVGQQSFRLEPGDVCHSRERNPLSDYYGMPPLMPVAGRVDLDNWMRQFVSSFWQNAGIPGGLLNIKGTLSGPNKDEIKGTFRQEFGGPRGWHRLMVLDNAEATYTQMGLPLGERGLVIPALDEINEGRITAAFGVPAPLVGARLGIMKATYGAALREVRASFWDETLIPLYKSVAGDLTRSLVPDFTGIDEIAFDLSDVSALQEDENAKHERVRQDVTAGIIGLREGRIEMGWPAEPEEPDTFMIPAATLPTPSKDVFEPEVEEPEPVPAPFSENGDREGEEIPA